MSTSLDRETTHSNSRNNTQQECSFGTMLRHCFTTRSDHQDENTRKIMQALIVSMAALESEMSTFNVHVVTQHMHDNPLNMWPKYDQYSGLAAASKDLEDTVKRVKTLVQSASFNTCCIDMYTCQAREISIKVSNTIATVMKTMSDKTKEIETEPGVESHESTDQEAAIAAIMSELAELVKHLTAAAESTWAALNLLEAIAARFSLQQSNKSTKIWANIPWVFCAFTAILAFVAAFAGHQNASQQPALHDMASSIAEMQSVCGLVNRNLDIAAQIRNATIDEFNQRFLAIERAWQNSDERIDNVWDALGPPNAQGTYFTQATGPDESTASVLKARMDRLEADALGFKRQVQRAEVRTTSRLNKLDRKRGGSDEKEAE